MWTYISNISSITTLVLFVLYFIGRLAFMKKDKNILYDEVDSVFGYDFNILNKKYKVIDIYQLSDENPDTSSAVIITSINGIREIVAHSCKYNSKKNKIIKGKELERHNYFLQPGHSVVFIAYLPEIFPEFVIEYETNDFVKCRLLGTDNMKSGVFDEFIEKRYSFKSYLYGMIK